MVKKPDMSIILVNYNTRELTRNCIKSIYEKTQGLEFDIWVVDNESTDGTCDMLRDEFPQVNIIQSGGNIGFGRANNLAIEKSNAKYILLLNTDTELINNAPLLFFEFMEKNPDTGACGGNLYNEKGEHVHSYGYFLDIKTKVIRMLQLKNFFPDIKQRIDDKGNNEKDEFKKVELIIGADLCIRKSVLDKIGYFDKDFFLYFEESELQFRMTKAGYNAYILPQAKLYHLEGKSSKIKKYKTEAKLKSEYLFCKKCYNIGRFSPYKLLFIASHIIRLFVTPLIVLKVWGFILRD